MNFVAIP